ncbi:MAG: tetratricopeptide repeat protein, partial [Spirochaetia bacterium]|nr:tetratricopeptide repeat protein [Spirochaetia bacterium]
KDADVARLKKVIQVRKLRAMVAEKMAEGEKALGAAENEKALALFVEIEGLDPETPDLRGNLATAYYRTGRYSKAILFYRSEYEKTENFFSALGSLYCLYYLGKYGDLLDEAQRIQSRHGSRDETEELVKVMVMAFRALGQRDKAIDLLTAARARDASRADYAILLGNLYFEQKDFEKAQELYEAVYQSSRNNFVVVYNLGVLHLKKGRVEKSLFYLNQALPLIDPKKKPELAESLAFQLAQVHYRMRAFREAEKQIENAAEFYTQTPEGKKGPNLNYAYWYANIFSRTPASFSNDTIHKKIFSSLDLCIGQSDDRELSARASYLKVILDPETRVFLKNPVKTLSDRTPVAISDLLVYQNRSNEIVAQNELSGKVIWKIQEQSTMSTPFVHEGQFIAYGLEGGVVHVVEEVGGRTVLRAREYARDLALEGGNVIALGQSLVSLNARGTNFQFPLTNLGMSR